MALVPPVRDLSIDCKSLRMHYPGQSRAVLEGLDLSVARGEFVAILGRSGSGKSTLLKLLGAMDRPSAGLLVVANQDLVSLDEVARTKFRRRHLGFIFQNYNLLPTLSVYDNLRLPLLLNRIPDADKIQRQLEALGLGDVLARFPSSLSGGEQQRVAIGRALIHAPSLVLADEPTGNLDRSTSEQVLGLFQQLIRTQGATVVMATHSHEAARFADTRYALVDGRLIAEP